MQNRAHVVSLSVFLFVTLGACAKTGSNGSSDRLCVSYCSARTSEQHAVNAAFRAVDTDLDAVGKLAPKSDPEMKQAAEQTQSSCIDVHEQLAFARGQILAMRDARAMVDDRVGNEAVFSQDLATAAHDVPACATASPAQLAAYRSRMATVEKTFADEFKDDPACVATCSASLAKKLGGGP